MLRRRGSTKASYHIPGYTGFIPASSSNAVATQQGRGFEERPAPTQKAPLREIMYAVSIVLLGCERVTYRWLLLFAVCLVEARMSPVTLASCREHQPTTAQRDRNSHVRYGIGLVRYLPAASASVVVLFVLSVLCFGFSLFLMPIVFVVRSEPKPRSDRQSALTSHSRCNVELIR